MFRIERYNLLQNFCFNDLVFSKEKYTDNRSGSPYHYLALMLTGHGKIVSKDVTIEVWPGDLFYIPEGLPYQSYWNSDNNINLLSFGFHHFPETKSKQFILQKINCEDKIINKIKEIPIKRTTDSLVIGSFYSVLAEIVERLEYNQNSAKKELVEKAKQYINEHIDCEVSDIAKHCMISKSALYNLFRQEFNLSPNQLIQKARCRKAQVLLTTTNKSVQEISDILEFSSTSYFRKILKIHIGKTPREIRNQAKNI